MPAPSVKQCTDVTKIAGADLKSWHFIKYCTVGGGNTLIHMAFAGLLVSFADWRPLLANVAAFLAANVFSFTANALLTFSMAPNWRRYPHFLTVSLTSLLLSSLFVGLAEIFGFHYLIAIAISALLSALLGFLLSAKWVFLINDRPTETNDNLRH